MINMENVGIILGSVIGGVVLIAVLVLLYIFVISKRSYKKQVREIERKFAYLDSLLIGQDSQYIHRLEVISHTNLLYVDKHETFSRRFKEIYENDDKYAGSLIKQLNALILNKQYKNIKLTISDAKKAVDILEENVNSLNDDLYQVIRLEEDSRKAILKLKEEYRVVKQTYYTNAGDMEVVSESVIKVFDKLDHTFAEYEKHIEGAEYDEAEALIPTITQVISAMGKIIGSLPNLCSLVKQVVPNKIEDITNQYEDILAKKIPVYHLSVDEKISKWNDSLAVLNNDLLQLKVNSTNSKCEQILKEIDESQVLLAKEVECKDLFERESDILYKKVKVLDDNFLKVCSLLPELNKVYIIEESQKQSIDDLKSNINKLWDTKRNLDGFIHSETKQPFTVLYGKLQNLNSDYDVANTALKDFKAYLDSLKSSTEEAYPMVRVYYYRIKQSENTLRIMALPEYTSQYDDQIKQVYDLIDEVNKNLQQRPINVSHVNELAEQLKTVGNDLFDAIEYKYRDCMLAESAIVYANRDRAQQSDVHQQLSVLEQNFFNGDFDKVYNDANAVYARSHIEETNRGKRG